MIVKYFGIFVDDEKKRIIHGESNLIYKIEGFTGLPSEIYETHYGQ